MIRSRLASLNQDVSVWRAISLLLFMLLLWSYLPIEDIHTQHTTDQSLQELWDSADEFTLSFTEQSLGHQSIRDVESLKILLISNKHDLSAFMDTHTLCIRADSRSYSGRKMLHE